MNEYNENTKIELFIKRKSFTNLLKGLKTISQQNYLLIQIYCFLMKNIFRAFLKRIILSKNEKNNGELKKLSSLYNYTIHVRSFFKTLADRKTYLMKKRDGLLFYNYKTKMKFFWVLNKFGYNMKIYREKVCQIYSNKLKENILKYLRKFYYNKYTRNTIKKIVYKKVFDLLRLKLASLKLVKPVAFKINPARKLFVWKSFKQSLKSSAQIDKIENKLKNAEIKLFTKLFFYKLGRFKNIRENIQRRSKRIINKKLLVFFERVCKRLSTKNKISSKIICLSTKITDYFKGFFFGIIYSDYLDKLQHENSLNKLFYERLYFKKLKLVVNEKKRFSALKILADNKTSKQIYLFKQFLRNIQKSLKVKIIISKADIFRFKKLSKDFFELIKTSFTIYSQEKEKYIKALLCFRKNYIEKLFSTLKLNKQIRNAKRSEYNKLFQQRKNVIEEYMFRLLISNCTKEMKQKDDLVTNLYIKRTTRGVKTALKWYQIMKNRITLKKVNNIKSVNFKAESDIARDNLVLPQQQAYNKNIDKDIDLLVNLRNKKRERPRSISKQ
jgi:hypothetical protein